MPKTKAVLTATIKHPKTGDEITLERLVPIKAVEDTPKEQVQSILQHELKSLALEPQFSITRLHNVYSNVDSIAPFEFGDTLVEINLPYCLHLPRGFETYVVIKDHVKARVEFDKTWTANASGSSETDFYSKNCVTYFRGDSIQTPSMPHDKKLGWDIVCEAKNAEKLMDRNGVYRYTTLRIFTETKLQSLPRDDEAFKALEAGIEAVCQEVVNRVLDTYKYVTKEIHVERVSNLTIMDVYFQNINEGYYPMPLNVGTALMNRTGEEIDKINEMLNDDISVPNHERLFLSARDSLNRKDSLLAIVESYQAFEIFLEGYLTEKFKKQGLSDEDTENKLHSTWKAKDRLKILLKEISGKSLEEIDNGAWNDWCRLNKVCRNEVIHAAKEIALSEAIDAVMINEKVVSLIRALP